MIHLKYKRLFGWLAAAMMLLTTSCKDELYGGSGNSDEVTVSFALAPEGGVASTRAVYEDDEHTKQLSNGNISDGSLIDMLIYAVYDEEGTLLEGYKGESDNIPGFTPGDGQTMKKIDKFPCEVTLTLKRGAKYTVAFWAQSSQCKVYDTENLRKVEMVYNNVKNNNETLDAFCRSFEITAGADNIENPIKLYRPLAQVNIGTSGFDYEISNRNSNKDYVYTKIRLNRAARYFDVFKDETYWNTTAEDGKKFSDEKTQETFAVVDYDYALLPAYINREKEPEYISHTRYDWLYNGGSYTLDGATLNDYKDEEFLKVHLYTDEKKDEDFNSDGTYTKDNYGKIVSNDGEYKETSDDYLDYANLNDQYNKKSETFKYLSMCYVLTSSTREEAITLNNVKAWIATDEKGTDSIEIVNLNNVPVQRNWRTNIIGNLLTDENSFIVKLDKDFAGEFNGIYNGDNADWTGALADGVYYDGAADEIQISNANGLLWFQRMVNGTMTVREAVNEEWVGKEYPYYIGGAKPEYHFSYNGISDPTTASGLSDEEMKKAIELKERILVATHQNKNTNNKEGEWPNNFHFTGTKDGKDYPATVKLMADIDMSGVEWIPIGFDGKMWDQLNDTFEESTADNRGFYGKFDGNNHTVSNLTTKRFGTYVHDQLEEREHNTTGPNGKRHWDALQWFGRGFFGEIGGNAEIHNLRLRNVDFKGCQGVGGIVGIACGEKIKIENCVVDGGSLEVTPLYRCDTWSANKAKNRTFARGVYLGGIAGYFYTNEGEMKNCEVRNLTMRGYRRLGGLIGSLDLDAGVQPSTGSKSIQKNISENISGNSVVNSILIASQFNVFGIRCEHTNGVYQTGFGWDPDVYDLLSQKFIGGDEKDLGKVANNSSSNFTLSRFTEHLDGGRRYSEMDGAPLKYMPLLSSWYTDEIKLYNNYYGEPSAKKIANVDNKFKVYSNAAADTEQSYMEENDDIVEYRFPINIPYEVNVTWDTEKTNPNVGLYVESVTLDGSGGVGGRSVITPTNVDKEGACAMLITARDRKQFTDKRVTNDSKNLDKNKEYQKPTIISNIVVRGEPYAYTGILLSPNENMNKIKLDHVAVYDVYQTIALDKASDYASDNENQWPRRSIINPNKIDIVATSCNLRGYTVPGAGWNSITFTATTFENGKSIGKGDNEKTYKAESATTFTDCFFKAPYIIERTGTTEGTEVEVTFKNCAATAANKNTPITPPTNWRRIEITSSTQGVAEVKYFDANNEEITETTTSPARRR